MRGMQMCTGKLLSKRAGYTIFCLLGFLFVFFYKTGKDLADTGNILWTTGYSLQVLAVSIVFGCLLGIAICFVIYRLTGSTSGKKLPHKESKIGQFIAGLSERKVFWGSLVLILLAWLPAFLAYYPGNCAYDTPIQTGQIVGNSFNDHHPIAHTLLLKAAMWGGSTVFDNVNTGIAAYTLVQMIFLGVVFCYGLTLLHRYRVKAGWLLLVLVLCMFHPFHWHMAVSVTKDTVFTGFMLLWMCAFGVLLKEGSNRLRPAKADLLLIISSVGMILTRNNAKYALLVPLVLLAALLCFQKKARKLWARMLICCGAAFLTGNMVLSGLFDATQATQGDRREMLSMPIQQLARTMIYHGGVGVLPEDDDTIQEADKALINEFLLNEAYRDYQASLSDPVKRHTNTYVVRHKPVAFVKTYLNLLRHYPGDFINAALAVNAGFLYADDISHAYVNENEELSGLGYMQTRWEEGTLNSRGIYKDSKWPALFEKLEKWADENGYLRLPVLKYVFMPGGFLWYYLLFVGYLLIKRNFRVLLPISLIGGYYLTMFLGPTVQLRYIYPVMVILPFIVLMWGGDHEY